MRLYLRYNPVIEPSLQGNETICTLDRTQWLNLVLKWNETIP